VHEIKPSLIAKCSYLELAGSPEKKRVNILNAWKSRFLKVHNSLFLYDICPGYTLEAPFRDVSE